MSGTLAEARRELHVLYEGRVQRVPLAKPDRRRWCGERLFADAARRDEAVVERVRQWCDRAGRCWWAPTALPHPRILASRLLAAGIDNQVLNAVQDADEAERIARAGRAGVVTVATNIAGRGTDIALDAPARAAGGLHVIATMRNRSRRIDRQLIGRAARHGDPGSAEACWRWTMRCSPSAGRARCGARCSAAPTAASCPLCWRGLSSAWRNAWPSGSSVRSAPSCAATNAMPARAYAFAGGTE